MFGTAVFYFSISIITAVFFEFSLRVKGTSKKICAALSILIPAFFAGIRYGIGTDYFVTYKPYFEYLAGHGSLQLVNRESLDIGFKIINLAVIKLGGNLQMVLFVSSVLTLFAFRKAILLYKDKMNVGMAAFVFMLMYYQTSFNIVRQVLAASIVLYAFHYIEEKEPFKFTLWVIVAALFHKTAVVVLPFYLFANLVSKRKHKILFFMAYVIIFFAVFNFDKFAPLARLIDPSGYYANYLRKVSSFEMSTGLLIRTIPYILAVILMWKKIQGDRTLYIYLNSFLFGSIMRIIVYMTQFDADRIAMYFLMSQVVFIPYLYKFRKQNWRYYAGSMLLVGTTILLWYFDFIYMGRNETVPYVTIFR